MPDAALSHASPTALRARPQATGLKGRLRPPGDKSISHRALLLNALAVGRARVTGMLEGEDVLDMAKALRALGAGVRREATAAGPVWTVDGVGVQGFSEPADVLDLGNSGTAARLLAGAIAGAPVFAVLTGDASLRSRPMARVTDPLARMGARFHGRAGGRLPLAIEGARDPMPLDYTSPVASAQVKSAILLAGLAAPGVTRVIEPAMSRDHTERMLQRMGAEIESGPAGADGGPGAWSAALRGQPELTAIDVDVPADPSSAAFPLVAAAITPGSEVRLDHVGQNPARAGLIVTLQEMGADIEIVDPRESGGEPVADLIVRGGALKGVEVPPERAASMIDEYPVLAVAAAVAEGVTHMRGIGELRVKETDRIAAVARGLAAAGVAVEEAPDALKVTGGRVAGGCTVATELDHRIAMSFLVLGLVADAPVAIDDAAPIATSFPGFQALMEGLGAAFEAPAA